MKQIFKHSKSLISLLLAMIMLLAVALPVMAEIIVGPTPPDSSENDEGEESVFDWITVESDSYGITITLHPDRKDSLSFSKAEIKKLLGDFADAFKELLSHKIKDALLPEGSSPEDYTGLSADEIWSAAVSAYIKNEYGADDKNGYDNFISDILNSSERMSDFSDYTCKLVRLAALSGIDYSSLPNPDNLNFKDELFDKFKSLLSDKVDNAGSGESIDSEITELIDILVPKYKETYADLEGVTGEIDIEKLFTLLNIVKVNDKVIFDGLFNIDNILTLIGELPTPEEIAVMGASDMLLSYGFFIGTELCDIAFNLTFAVADDCEEWVYESIRDKFRVLAEHFNFSCSASSVSMFLEIPESFTDVVLSVIDEGSIPDVLRDKVVKVSKSDGGAGFAFSGDMTLDDFVLLLEAVDFNGKISDKEDINSVKEILSKYFNVDGLNTDELRAKAQKLEKYLNSAKDKAVDNYDRIFDFISEDYRDISLSEIYDPQSQDGASFTRTEDLVIEESAVNKLLRKVISFYPEHEGKIRYIFSLLDLSGYEAKLDLDISMSGFYRVEYKIKNYVYKEAFLPEGADPKVFALDLQYFEGIKIEGWTLENGDDVPTYMPADNLTLYAKLAEVEINVTQDGSFISVPEGFVAVFDGKEHKLTANTVEEINSATVTYKWYRNGELVAEGDTLSVKNFSDTGLYKCVALIQYGSGFSYEASSQEFSIDFAIPPFAAEISSQKLSDHTYRINSGILGVTDELASYIDGIEYRWYYGTHEDTLTLIDGENSSYLDVFGNSANGFYRAEVIFNVDGQEVALESNAVEISIDKIVITPEELFDLHAFDLTDPKNFFYYDGASHNVIKDNIQLPVDFSDFEATAPGKYIAAANIREDAKADYIFEGGVESLTLEWYIVEKLSLSFSAPTTFVYSGNKNYITVILPESLTSFDITYKWYRIDGTEQTLIEDATDATLGLVNVSQSGTYKCIVTVNSYGLEQTEEAAVNITISPKPIHWRDFIWSTPSGVVYNGNIQKFNVVSIPDEYRNVVSVDYDTLTDAIESSVSVKKPGNYEVTVAFFVTDDNYVMTSEPVDTVTISVAKAEFDLSKIKWSYLGPYFFEEGVLRKVFLEGYDSFTFGDILVIYEQGSVNEAVEVGNYQAVFKEFRVKDGEADYPLGDYYTLINSGVFAPALAWSVILPDIPVVPDLEFVYDENGIYVKVVDADGYLRDCFIRVTKKDIDFVSLVSGKKYKVSEAYEITFVDFEGNPVSFDTPGNFEVTFKIPDGVNAEDLEIIFIGEKEQNHSIIDSSISQDGLEISFNTTHFSIYAMATEYVDPVIPPDDPNLPPSDDPDIPPTDEPAEPPVGGLEDLTLRHYAIIAGIIILFMILFVLFSIYLKKNRKYNKFRKSLLVNEYDETVELYEDLKPLEWGAPESVFVDGELPPPAKIDESLENSRERGPRVNVEYKAPDKVKLERTLGYIKEIPDERVRRTISRVDALIPEVSITPNPIVIGPTVIGVEPSPMSQETRKVIAKARVKGVDPMVLAAFGLNANKPPKSTNDARQFIQIPVIDDSELFEEDEQSPSMIFINREGEKKAKNNEAIPTVIPIPNIQEDKPPKKSFGREAIFPISVTEQRESNKNVPVAPIAPIPVIFNEEREKETYIPQVPVSPIVVPTGMKEKKQTQTPEAPIVMPMPSAEEVKEAPKSEPQIIPVLTGEEKKQTKAPEAPIVMPMPSAEEVREAPKSEPQIIPVLAGEEKKQTKSSEAPIVMPMPSAEEVKEIPKSEPQIIPVLTGEEKMQTQTPEAPIVMPMQSAEEVKNASDGETGTVIPLYNNNEEKPVSRSNDTVIPIVQSYDTASKNSSESITVPLVISDSTDNSPVTTSASLKAIPYTDGYKPKTRWVDPNSLVIPFSKTPSEVASVSDKNNSSVVVPVNAENTAREAVTNGSPVVVPVNGEKTVQQTNSTGTPTVIPISNANSNNFVSANDGAVILPVRSDSVNSDVTEDAPTIPLDLTKEDSNEPMDSAAVVPTEKDSGADEVALEDKKVMIPVKDERGKTAYIASEKSTVLPAACEKDEVTSEITPLAAQDLSSTEESKLQ